MRTFRLAWQWHGTQSRLCHRNRTAGSSEQQGLGGGDPERRTGQVIVVDSGAFIAAAEVDDRHHGAFSRLIGERGEELIVPVASSSKCAGCSAVLCQSTAKLLPGIDRERRAQGGVPPSCRLPTKRRTSRDLPRSPSWSSGRHGGCHRRAAQRHDRRHDRSPTLLHRSAKSRTALRAAS